MTLEVITGLIANLGFPIAIVIALGAFIWSIYKQSVAREEKLMNEIAENRTINQKFAEIIAGYEITLGEIKTDVKEIKETLNNQNN